MSFILKLIKSPLVRAHVLSGVRSVVAAGAAILVTKGYVDENLATQITGLAVGVAAFWLGAKDVATVDKKIEAASQIYPDSTKSKDEIEKEITKQLNRNQGKIGKAGW